jgi:hypothetical protein
MPKFAVRNGNGIEGDGGSGEGFTVTAANQADAEAKAAERLPEDRPDWVVLDVSPV